MLAIITGHRESIERTYRASQSAALLRSQLALLEQCGNNFGQFLDQMVNNSLHPSILIWQLSREPLPKSADSNPGELLLHQAVHVELEKANPRGLITLDKLIEMGFDVNVLDSNGETAINQLFKIKKSCHPTRPTAIISRFLRLEGSQSFNVSQLLEHLGSKFSMSNHVGFGTCVLK